MSVENIRKTIDDIDNRVHDLLMERAELVLKIGAEKRKNNVQVIQPDREIIMLRRLLGRHKGPLPREAVVRIWRELVGAVSLLQTGLKVAVTAPGGAADILYWDMAKDYFSSVLPMVKAAKPLSVLSMVREGEATFGVLPWPADRAADAWWPYLMDDESEKPMRIVARLPLGDRTDAALPPERQALVVAKLRFDPSGDDRGFIALALPQDVSRARLAEKATAAGLNLRGVCDAAGKGSAAALYLLEIAGYCAPGDEALNALAESLGGGRAAVLGGYPVPPVYNDAVGKSAGL